MQSIASGQRDHAHSLAITPQSFHFTPGPWHAIGHRRIAACPQGGMPICEVWSGAVGIDQADANERLIAAAPDLAGMLAAVLASVISGETAMPADLFERAGAALAAAVDVVPGVDFNRIFSLLVEILDVEAELKRGIETDLKRGES